MALTTHAGKGSELTWAEADANFTGLADGSLITALPVLLISFCSDAKKAAIKAGTQTDVAAEFILAVAEACSSGRDLELPEGKPVITSATFTKGIRLFGHGMRTLLYVDSAVGATTDILTISPGAADDASRTGYVFENFYMLPVSGTPGRHAIAIDITTRAVYESKFRKLRLNALGGKGFVTLPNASPLTDGFFTSSIEDSVIYNGVYLDKAGDSIRVMHNTIAGANAGVYADLVYVSAANQAHGLDIIGNNITSTGGCLLIKSAYGGRATRNIFESATGTANNALVDLDGTDATNKPDGFDCYDNAFNTPTGVDAVRVNFMRRAKIRENLINEPGGGGVCLRVTANGTDTQYLFNDTNLDSTLASQITDAGTRTFALRDGIGGRLETNQDIQMMGQGANLRAVDTAGTTIRVVRLESADNTVKIGAIDAPANNGHCLLYAGGAEGARVNPTTLSLQTVGKVYPGTDAGARQTAAGIYGGSGIPNNANGSNGDFYFRSDGTKAGSTVIYHREAGAWVALTS